MKHKAAALGTLLFGAVLALAAAAPAAADTPPDSSVMQQRVEAAMAHVPGGVQVAWNEVSWDDGAIVLTLAAEGALAAAVAGSDCASGQFCVYSAQNYKGNKLTFSTCTSNHSVSGLGAAVRSIANSRTSGTVMAYNNGTYVTTVAAGTGKNILVAITPLSCA